MTESGGAASISSHQKELSSLKPQFDFYEVVQVRNSEETDKLPVVGQEGAILGMAEEEEGRWNYAVFIYSLSECWHFGERELETTGKWDKKETFYDGSHITVLVDPDTGYGRIG